MRLSIVLLIRSLHVGGAERQLVVLARGLAARGHRVTVLTFYPGGQLEADLADTGVTLVCAEKTGRWDTLLFLVRLARLVREQQADVLYSFLSAANVIAALLSPFLPGTRLVWGVRASDMDLSQYDWLTRLVWQAERVASRMPAKVIANSSAGRDHVVSHGFPAARTTMIPNGIDTVRFSPDRAHGLAFRTRWGLGPDIKLVGLVGRLDPMKDHSTFLRAAAATAAREPSVVFLCIGDGPTTYRDALQQQARELGIADRVVWTGGCSDMFAAYNSLDVLCSSSITEGFPNVIGEAMACGVGCVVTDVGDSALLVGDTGLVVPRRQPDALASALSRALHGGVNGAAARERVVSRFSVEALIESTERELTALLTSRGQKRSGRRGFSSADVSG